jgi:hypothetical protein
MTYVDQLRECRDCSQDFVWSAAEQELYLARGVQREPDRCPECRAARRSAVAAGVFAADGPYGAYRQRSRTTCVQCGRAEYIPFPLQEDLSPYVCTICSAAARQPVSTMERR